MPELLKHTVTKQELEEGEIPANFVLCETFYTQEGAKTKSGIIYGVNTDLLYNNADDVDDKSAHNADLAVVAFMVKKLPKSLYYNPKDKERSMHWETTIEVQEGDYVWCNLIESANAVTLMCEGKEYRLLPYQDLICAKRPITLSTNLIPDNFSPSDFLKAWKQTGILMVKSQEMDTQITPINDSVIMLNGYCLCEQERKVLLSELDVISQDEIDVTKGRIAYVGSMNKSYIREDLTDFVDLRKGDLVLFDRRVPPFLLERQKYASQFDPTKLYWVAQRCRIVAVIERA